MARDNGQEAVVITRMAPGPYGSTNLTSNDEENDTRIGLHVLKSRAQRILVLSPDTDTYHIGLRFSSQGARELNLLHLHKLVDLLRRDPDMVQIPPSYSNTRNNSNIVRTVCQARMRGDSSEPPFIT